MDAKTVKAKYEHVLKERWEWDVQEHNIWQEDEGGASHIVARIPESDQDRWAHPESTVNGQFIAAAPAIVSDLIAENDELKSVIKTLEAKLTRALLDDNQQR